MKIEVGRFYRTRGGKIAKVLYEFPNCAYQFGCVVDYLLFYVYPDGKRFNPGFNFEAIDGEASNDWADLIAEAAPSEWIGI